MHFPLVRKIANYISWPLLSGIALIIRDNLLIVDDDRTTASVMQLHLDNFGYHIAGIASSAKEAINIARDLKPDLVLMDIKLGEGADGIDAALAISKHMNIPIVFVTAHSDNKTLRRAKIVNPAGFINKPLRESDLKTTIDRKSVV